jgi:phosphoglycerate dehydrogenase-like enzyme
LKIVSTAKMSDRHQTNLRENYQMHEFSFYDNMEATPLEALEKVEILVTYGEDLTPDIIKKMPGLTWIQVLSAGLELMPFEELIERRIQVTNAKGIHRIPMAEYTMSMILQLSRKHYSFYDLQKEGIWDRSLRVDEVYGKTLGILGLGAIGSEIAKRAQAFGMRVLGMRRSEGEAPEYVDELISFKEKEKFFRESDFLVVLLPLTQHTANFVGHEELQMMKSSAYLINIARGQVVNEEELLHALKEEKIAGAVLDVFTEEPLPSDHPFWQTERLILTPHVSGRSPHYMQRAIEIFRENLSKYPEDGDMINMIQLDKGY